jgi:hypothetical protein
VPTSPDEVFDHQEDVEEMPEPNPLDPPDEVEPDSDDEKKEGEGENEE